MARKSPKMKLNNFNLTDLCDSVAAFIYLFIYFFFFFFFFYTETFYIIGVNAPY